MKKDSRGLCRGAAEDRLRQMEAQLEEKNKELQRVPVLTGRRRLGRRRGLGALRIFLLLLLHLLYNFPDLALCSLQQGRGRGWGEKRNPVLRTGRGE